VRTLRSSTVQSNQFNTHEVVSWGHTGGHVEVVPAAVRDHGVYSPLAVCETIVCDLEPLESSRAGRGGVVYFGKPVTDRAC
jgi:hypothetical protein